MIVVDDRLLFEILAGVETPTLGDLATDGVATSFSWYFRLSRALTTDRIEGSLSTMFAALSDDRRRYVHGLIEDLPSTIEMLHPRELVPSMSSIAALVSVNFLTAEAIATSLILEATIVVSTASAVMDRAALAAGVECVLVPRV